MSTRVAELVLFTRIGSDTSDAVPSFLARNVIGIASGSAPNIISPDKSSFSMPNTKDVCNRIYALVKLLSQEVDNCSGSISEEARKVYRMCKRVELIVSDLEPYAKPGPSLWFSLGQVEAVLVETRQVLLDLYRCGNVSVFLLAEQSLVRFKGCCTQLHTALEGFLNPELSIPIDTQEEVSALMVVLLKMEFSLKTDHQQVLDSFRNSCEALNTPFAEMQKACVAMLKMVGQPSVMTKEVYGATVCDLQQEISSCAGSTDTAFLLRMMLDVLRTHHGHHDAPLEFLCPLSLSIMIDPVLLHETGNTYERHAIEDWWVNGHRFCPRSGVPLSWRLHLSPNVNLRDAISRWRLHHEHQLSTRPVLSTLTFLSHITSWATPLPDGEDGEPTDGIARSARLNSASQENLESGYPVAIDKQQRANQLYTQEKQQALQLQYQQQQQQQQQKQQQQQQQHHLLGSKLPVGGGQGLLGRFFSISPGNGSPTVPTSKGSITNGGSVSNGRPTLSRDSSGSVSMGARSAKMSAISLAMAAGRQPPSVGPSLASSAASIAAMTQNAASSHSARSSVPSGNGYLSSIFYERSSAPSPAPPAYGNGLHESFSAKQQQQQSTTNALQSSDGDSGAPLLITLSDGGAVAEESQHKMPTQFSLPIKHSHIGTAEGWQQQFGARAVAPSADLLGQEEGLEPATSPAVEAEQPAASSPIDVGQLSDGVVTAAALVAIDETGGDSEKAVAVSSEEREKSEGGAGEWEVRRETNAEAVARSPYYVSVGFPLSVTPKASLLHNTGSGKAGYFGNSLRSMTQGNEFGGGAHVTAIYPVDVVGVDVSEGAAVVSAADFADEE